MSRPDLTEGPTRRIVLEAGIAAGAIAAAGSTTGYAAAEHVARNPEGAVTQHVRLLVNGKEYDYSSLAGFRVARTLP